MSARKAQEELAKIEGAIDRLETLRGILPDAQFEASLRALEENRAALRAELGSAAARASGRGVAVGRDIKGSLVNTGRIEGNVYFGPPTDDPEEALRIYREVLVSTCSDVPLRAVDIATSDASGRQKGMDLAAIYVHLDTTAQIAVNSRATAEHAIRRASGDARSLHAIEAAAQHSKLVLLGDPGSGKSTFLSYIARCLAADALDPSGGWRARLAGWPRAEQGLLPVLVILRDFARSLPAEPPAQATPAQLWSFIAARLGEQNLSFAEKPILSALDQGRALVLLDGLDEVPTDALRSRVRNAAAAFIDRYPRSNFIVTCRILPYQDPAWQLPALPSFTLAPFDEPKIARFIEAWHAELGRRNVLSPQDAADLSVQLAEAVKRPDLARLAPNPLLLTAMAVVHTSRGRLPDARAKLYEETVDLLLWHREELKTRRLRELLLQVGLADTDLRRVLSRLAFEAHGAVPAGDGEALAGIEEHRIELAFAAQHPEKRGRDWAHDVVDAMKLRAGLLVERKPGVYTFPHRTFQEYLAGAHLSAEGKFVTRAAELAGQGTQWREVILLAVGRLVHVAGDTDRPLALASELCPSRAVDSEVGWRNAWLAGEVLLEVGLHRLEGSALGADLVERVPARLVELLRKGRLTAVERAKAGDVLGRLGDPRFDPEAWWLPREEALGFVEVPAGKFWMGSEEEAEEEDVCSEQPYHQVDLPGYWIGKYPVTVMQFRAFVEESGHEPKSRSCMKGVANHPVVYVTWDEAMSYAAWLTERLRGSRKTPDPLGTLLRQGWRVTLPSEAEWEKAARGTDGRAYPWGEDADPTRANYYETGLESIAAVGCFPGGASPYRCEDMIGNVWEWTRSRHMPYPYQRASEVHHTGEHTQELRVSRGGDFENDDRAARCAWRTLSSRMGYYTYVGFRVVVSPGP